MLTTLQRNYNRKMTKNYVIKGQLYKEIIGNSSFVKFNDKKISELHLDHIVFKILLYLQ